jgi:hypothetical protein
MLKLAELYLHNTNIEFNGEHFLQIGGTSMRNPLPPQKQRFSSAKKRKTSTRAWITNQTNPLRYIDDEFFYWTNSLDNLNRFMTYMIDRYNTTSPLK